MSDKQQNPPFDSAQDRREFLRTAGRYAALGTMAAGGALIASRGEIDRDGQVCINKSVCCNCGAYRGCRLPAALSAKEAGMEPGEQTG